MYKSFIKNNKMVHIAVLMMVKNEKLRLHITLNSIKNFADSIILFDTGSEDNTIEIAKTFCKENNIPLRLKEGKFTNFAISRNESLDYVDTFDDIDYVVLLDVNDELQGGDLLRKYCEEYQNNPSSGFLLCQEWFSGSHDKYFNVRLIKPHKKWRYIGAVHEYIKTSDPEFEKHPIVKFPDNVIIYQDRTQDDDKSGKRFKRDKELLIAEHEKDPTEPRSLFYLAQTCACLDEKEEALKYYIERSKLEGFQEEKFHALLRAGEISQKLGKDWHECFVWYWKAFEHSSRVEPLLFIAIYYIGIKNWIISFTFIKLACSIQYPVDSILFVNRNDYDYKRWHLLGIVAFYVGQYQDGKIGCLNAIQYCKNAINCKISSEIDEKNLKFYEEKEFESNNTHVLGCDHSHHNNHLTSLTNSENPQQQNPQVPDILTKKKFIEQKSEELRKQFPKYNSKQINSAVNNLWKNRQKS